MIANRFYSRKDLRELISLKSGMGTHLILELYDCDPEVLDDLSRIEEILLKAAKFANLKIINQRTHRFKPCGITSMVLISESHISIHTWPEHGFIAADIFVCGSDTHGAPIELAAKNVGVSPRELVEKYHAQLQRNFKQLRIDVDYYGSTDEPYHYQRAQSIIQTLEKKGYTETREVELPYCPNCENYLADRFLVGTCPFCGAEARPILLWAEDRPYRGLQRQRYPRWRHKRQVHRKGFRSVQES